MSESLQQQLQQAMSEFTKQQESLIRARDEVAAMSVTMRSKDRAVEVTVGAQGEPTALRFLNNKHQTMSGQALALSVLEVMTLAREEIARQVTGRFEEVSGMGLGVAGSNLNDLNLDRLLEPLEGEGLLAGMRLGAEEPGESGSAKQQ
ncbi:YbaB/EbfC family nucleoid-associated protein [Streptomyces kunmingensis]|uniref:YbaB/EbfC family nucleoid-associated protein n=1 Tax=Streptomyces kunmingensis TaxID=68225 RepID=A0ABU6CG53_9ACTN|nr:YbaB/EbfC family nucleoid-associated protein [Streptomyces kunmingensis]MEB3963001.1 YbaB/EbfC family nucleoid-associated protein [Streptomyces kunmingensis]